jgi:hypothetical protein
MWGGSGRRLAVVSVSSPEFCRLVGVTYRVADYWARVGVLRPSVAEAAGSGSQRRYSMQDVRIGRVLAELGRHGCGTVVLSQVVDRLERLAEPWAGYLVVSSSGEVMWAPTPTVALEAEGLTAAWVVSLAAANVQQERLVS